MPLIIDLAGGIILLLYIFRLHRTIQYQDQVIRAYKESVELRDEVIKGYQDLFEGLPSQIEMLMAQVLCHARRKGSK